jgi:hypothetical protein
MFEMHVNVCIHIISYLPSFQGDFVWKCVMDFNVDARNGYEDPSNNFLEKMWRERLIGGKHLIPYQLGSSKSVLTLRV